MSFARQTAAFFKELGAIIEEQRKEKERGMEPDTERPFSSMLTQDEEPGEEYNPPGVEEPEPEVITRFGGA